MMFLGDMEGDITDKKKIINTVVISMGVLTFCFFICACVVSTNANAGFNVVLTALLYVVHVSVLGVGFNRERLVDNGPKAAMAIPPLVGGVLIGVTTMMSFVSLMTAIYWGQMSGCESGTDITGYSCDSASGMAAVSWFASFLLIVDVGLLAALVLWKDELFTTEGYDDFDGRAGGTEANSSTYAYDGATFGTGGISGGMSENDDLNTPQHTDL